MTLRFRARHAALRPAALAAPVLFVGALLLSGCAAAVPMQPAPDATNAKCADVVVHLPISVADKAELETNAQATGAWGEPGASAILLHCGVDVPGPTTLPCVSINGVDWIEDDADAPLYRFTTYGREPAVEVVVDSKAVAGSTVLADLTNAVSVIPATGACLGADDVTLPSDAPTP
ncbi:DUF3515 domain-containing protein [Leifsonia sp. YAF41]|uniref:DUF3515 domain-containing protein n=1 Tax=Leifsonia sp. YAF41 TaxID=3233086 RepID=UPI003F9CE3F8